MLRPSAIDPGTLTRAIQAQFPVPEHPLEFVPVGEDSWCYRLGDLWVSVRQDLRGHTPAAYEAAARLRASGLEFVLAPIAGADGRFVRRLEGFPVVVFPYVCVEQLDVARASADDRCTVTAMLARVHGASIDLDLPRETYELSFEGDLDCVLAAADGQPPESGPYTARLHALLRRHRGVIADMRAESRRLAAICAADPEPLVLTHGEPIPSNILRSAGSLLLGDWGDMLWGPPERDWSHLRRTLHIERAGRPAFLRFYDIKWVLSEIAEYATTFLRPHTGHADDVAMWQRLLRYLPAGDEPPTGDRPAEFRPGIAEATIEAGGTRGVPGVVGGRRVARLVRWTSGPGDGTPLVCLPWAGAGASVFKSWPRWLPAGIDVWGARFPGRESRLAEHPRGVEQVVGEFADDLEALLDRDPVLLGYCSGAVVAYELAFELRRRGRRAAQLLVVGQPAPSARVARDHSSEVRDALRMFGFTDERILEDTEMMELLGPAIRADFAMVDDVRPRRDRPLDIPIAVFVGRGDPWIPRAAVTAWAAETTGRFDVVELEGDHLFTGASAPTLVAAVGAQVRTRGGESR